jgi:hypothetical protein
MIPSSRGEKMITVLEIVVALLVYAAIAQWRRKRQEKRGDRDYAQELSRNWERNPKIYSH